MFETNSLYAGPFAKLPKIRPGAKFAMWTSLIHYKTIYFWCVVLYLLNFDNMNKRRSLIRFWFSFSDSRFRTIDLSWAFVDSRFLWTNCSSKNQWNSNLMKNSQPLWIKCCWYPKNPTVPIPNTKVADIKKSESKNEIQRSIPVKLNSEVFDVVVFTFSVVITTLRLNREWKNTDSLAIIPWIR
jgi:hypothetical protein